MATSNKNFKVKNGLDVNGPIGVGSTPSYGSAGQVLTSQGTGSVPIWATVSSSGLTSSDYVVQGRLTQNETVTANQDLLLPFVDDFDPQGWWNASTKRFLPNVAGYYVITLQVWWAAAAVSNNQNNIQIRKNGGTFAISQQPLHTADGSSQNATKLVYLNGTTDYVDFTAYSGNTTSQTLQWGGNSNGQGTFFSAALLTAGKGDPGDPGADGASGADGADGAPGPGVASGGTAGQILSKVDGTDYNTTWIDNYAVQIKHEVKLGEAISKGQAVYVSSANGTNMIVSKASNASESTSSKTMGLLETGGSTNALVKVITEGLLAGFDTSSATAGDPVWLGTSGNLIYGSSNKPVAPAHMVFIGIVTRSHATQGEIFVRPQNGFEINELHDISIDTPADNEVLAYDTASGLWKNQTASEAGLSAVGHTHDDRYYTETETDTAISTAITALNLGTMSTQSSSNYAALSGATFSGAVTTNGGIVGAAAKNMTVASKMPGGASASTGVAVIMTAASTGNSQPTKRPDGTDLVAGDIWISW